MLVHNCRQYSVWRAVFDKICARKRSGQLSPGGEVIESLLNEKRHRNW